MASQSKSKQRPVPVSEVLNQHRDLGSTGALEIHTAFGSCTFQLQAGRVIHVNADESSENTDVEALFASPCLSTHFEPTSAAQPAKRTLLFTTDTPLPQPTPPAMERTIRIPPTDLGDVRKRVAEAKAKAKAATAKTPPAPPETANNVKPTLGRYEVVSRIATGGMGSVFLCTARGAHSFQRHVAVKVLRTDLSHDQRAINALLHEAQLGSLVTHPNLIRAIDFGEHDKQPYLVMDYVEGITLAQITRHGAVPSPIAVKIVLDALAGLAAFHRLCRSNGEPLEAIHCDISPQNLLIGTDGVCRLIDYSSARSKVLRSEIQRTEGRAAYLAPERLMGQNFDRRSDLFALGVVLYECLTGHRLFAAETNEATLNNIVTKVPVAPSQFGPNCPMSFDALCLKAIDREQNLRFQSAEEMLDVLHQTALSEGRLASDYDVARFVETHFPVEVALLRARLPSSTLAVAPNPPAQAPAQAQPRSRTGEFSVDPETHSPARVGSGARAAVGSHAGLEEGTERILRSLSAINTKQRALWIAGAVSVLLILALTVLRPSALSFLFQIEGLDDPAAAETGVTDEGAAAVEIEPVPVPETVKQP